MTKRLELNFQSHMATTLDQPTTIGFWKPHVYLAGFFKHAERYQDFSMSRMFRKACFNERYLLLQANTTFRLHDSRFTVPLSLKKALNLNRFQSGSTKLINIEFCSESKVVSVRRRSIDRLTEPGLNICQWLPTWRQFKRQMVTKINNQSNITNNFMVSKYLHLLRFFSLATHIYSQDLQHLHFALKSYLLPITGIMNIFAKRFCLLRYDLAVSTHANTIHFKSKQRA